MWQKQRTVVTAKPWSETVSQLRWTCIAAAERVAESSTAVSPDRTVAVVAVPCKIAAFAASTAVVPAGHRSFASAATVTALSSFAVGVAAGCTAVLTGRLCTAGLAAGHTATALKGFVGHSKLASSVLAGSEPARSRTTVSGSSRRVVGVGSGIPSGLD